MHYAIFNDVEEATYPIAFLVQVIKLEPIKKEYMDRFSIPEHEAIVFQSYTMEGKKKTPKKEMVKWIEEELVPQMKQIEAKYLIVSDVEYFKTLTNAGKAMSNLGYVLPSIFGDWFVVYVPSHRTIFYNPEEVRKNIEQSMLAFLDHVNGTYVPPGQDIIVFAEYPKTEPEIKVWLDKLLAMQVPLSIDIEAFSLSPMQAGIGSISFAWNAGEGIAFPVDYEPIEGATEAPYGINKRNEPVRKLLKEFFEKLLTKQQYHNITYDVSVLIYQLFMNDITDTEGLLNGLEVMLRNWDDTKLITYLATNSCAGNDLSLKTQAQQFAGNWAMDSIKDITQIPLDTLLRYNLVDSLSTWFVLDKHYPTMILDNQQNIYKTIFKPAVVDIIQMQLTGLPMNMERVLEVEQILQADQDKALDTIHGTNTVKEFTLLLNEQWVIWKNSKLKKKQVTLADAKEVFNPNSGPQLQKLLFEFLQLPVLELTDSKQPSTDGDTIKALRNHTTDPDVLDFLNALLDYGAVNKILTSFIPAMKRAPQGKDGWHYLCGFLTLGGTVSGRLSSNSVNLQQLPASGSKYAKVFKSCFQSPPGYLFCGLDFQSLEDKISALTTKDKNKLKVYTDGYCGHCLRTFSYFNDQLSGIQLAPINDPCYKANVGGTDVYFYASETLEHNGTLYKGRELYELFINKKL